LSIRRVPEVTAEAENFRLEPVPGLRAVRPRRDPVEPVPTGSYVVMVFRVTGYDRDCDGSLMARLENVSADGEVTGWNPSHLGLYPNSTWVTDGPDLEQEALAAGARDERDRIRNRLAADQTADHAPADSDYGVVCRTCVTWHDSEGAHEFGIALPVLWPCPVAQALEPES
jgi:hypothetical protein